MVWRPDKEFLELIDEINRLNGMLKAVEEERIRYGWWKSHYLIEQAAYDKSREIYRRMEDIIVEYVKKHY